MCGDRMCNRLTESRTRRVSTPLHVLGPTGGIAVLLFLIAGHGVAYGEGVHARDFSVYQFSCHFQFSVGPGRLDGLMVSSGSRCRIAVYWIEPDVFREGTSFVRYSDFIVASEEAHYWIQPGNQRGTFPLSDEATDRLLPCEDSVESIARSALAIVNHVKAQSQGARGTLEVGKFFHNGRGLPEYAYEAVHDQADSNDLDPATDSDVRALNGLAAGREYSKEKQNDGTFVWRAGRAFGAPPVAVVIVKPAVSIRKDNYRGVFDTDSLGQWSLIPEPYRIYWSFDRALSTLNEPADERTASRALCDRIELYLGSHDLPSELRRGMHRLWCKAALTTDDPDSVCRSVQTAVRGLCEDGSISKYRALLELARLTGQIEKRCPEQSLECLRPLVRQTVKHGMGDIRDCFDRLVPLIDANRWFTFGELLLDEIRRRDLMDEAAIKQAVLRLEAGRLAREVQPPDSCESSARVREYLACLDINPPKGIIDINDVHHILEKGLAGYFTDDDAAPKLGIVEDVTQLIRLILGEGPFRGNGDELAKSIARFSQCYFAIYGDSQPINSVLATFLALSFCDISTEQDHAILASQVYQQCTEIQSRINTMLSDRGLDVLVGPNDVENSFRTYEQVFRKYIDDPLWPAFKFPLTSNEEARLAGNLGLRAMRLTPILDEMSAKVKYGGMSPQLKDRTLSEIARVAEQLLPETAFLRKPPYPGVSCHYRRSLGFTAMIDGPFYEEGKRAKEKFKAMKYFHMGHRLQEVVERERELARREHEQEQSP